MSEHKIGEQWIEELDGKRHMLKAVQSDHLCSGCAFSCTTFCRDPLMSERDIDCSKMIVIKDLGVFNEDGALPDYHTGKYPTIKDRNEGQGWLGHIWDCIVCEKIGNDDEAIEIRVSALTRQEAIDRWNRRA